MMERRDGKVDNQQSKAPCRDVDPELFFPTGKYEETVEMAKRICRRCSVRKECLQTAMEQGEQYGIWGGTTGDERRNLRRRGLGARHKPKRLNTTKRIATGQ